MNKTRFFVTLLAWSVSLAVLAVAAVWAPIVGLFVHWGAALLAPLVLTIMVVRRVPCRTPRHPVGAFVVEFLYAWGVLLAAAAGWGLLLDLVALPVYGWAFGGSWGGIVWASSHSGGQAPAVLILPFGYLMYGWVVGLVSAIVKRVLRAVPSDDGF
jgi:hypothetical protein